VTARLQIDRRSHHSVTSAAHKGLLQLSHQLLQYLQLPLVLVHSTQVFLLPLRLEYVSYGSAVGGNTAAS
jgi:hypothetical protein